MKLPKNLKKPLFVRPNDYVTVEGSDYIIKRNEFGQMVKVIGRVSRKLPSPKDVIWAINAHRKVAYWGNKYFMFEGIDAEVLDAIMQVIWVVEKRRGIDPPDINEIEDAIFDF